MRMFFVGLYCEAGVSTFVEIYFVYYMYLCRMNRYCMLGHADD